MAQTEEFMFQNVAHRPTVYKTGIKALSYQMKTLSTICFWGSRKIEVETRKIMQGK